MSGSTTEVTHALERVRAGQDSAVAALMPLVYDELRALAGAFFAERRDAPTLEPTAVVNEAFIKLVRGAPVDWQSKAHFFAVAAKAMRHIIGDHARGQRSDKRGGDWQRVTMLALNHAEVSRQDFDVLALDDALGRLAELDPRQAQVVELRVLSGMSIAETAHVLNISTSSVERDWVMGRMWLRRELA